jgi:[acyl-carrier-protein] S-malonyltransferase
MNPQSTAFIFPGQGSQKPGMGRELYEARPEAREIFDRADEVFAESHPDVSLSRLCFEGTEEDLRRTSITQPALFTVSAAALAVLRAEGVEAGWCAGHSLGEYTALFAAGSLDFDTALALVAARGAAMERAGRERPGAMAAAIGLDSAAIEGVCREAAPAGVVVAANWNSPEQVVLSGEVEAVDRAVELAKAAGAKKVVKLVVGGAFHSPLMAPAAEAMRELLRNAPIRPPAMQFVANVSAEVVGDPEAIRQGLIDQITSCVRWTESVICMERGGVKDSIEVGPGKVLSGLLRRIDRSLIGHNFFDESDLSRIVGEGKKA